MRTEYFMFVHHTTSILARLSTWCFEHSGDINCSLLVSPRRADESWGGRDTCLWICICVCVACLWVCICVCVYVCVCVCACMCVCAYMYVCVYVCVWCISCILYLCSLFYLLVVCNPGRMNRFAFIFAWGGSSLGRWSAFGLSASWAFLWVRGGRVHLVFASRSRPSHYLALLRLLPGLGAMSKIDNYVVFRG